MHVGLFMLAGAAGLVAPRISDEDHRVLITIAGPRSTAVPAFKQAAQGEVSDVSRTLPRSESALVCGEGAERTVRVKVWEAYEGRLTSELARAKVEPAEYVTAGRMLVYETVAPVPPKVLMLHALKLLIGQGLQRRSSLADQVCPAFPTLQREVSGPLIANLIALDASLPAEARAAAEQDVARIIAARTPPAPRTGNTIKDLDKTSKPLNKQP